MLILGLNAYHPDSAACLVRDGVVVAAAEEERFRRIKHWAGFPSRAIRSCLADASVRLADISVIAVNRRPGVHPLRRAWFVIRHRPHARLVLQKLVHLRKVACIRAALTKEFGAEAAHVRVEHVEHHLAHMASTYLVSGFDKAVCLSLDGFGDFASAAWGLGQHGRIQVDDRIYFPHSLGVFYAAITQFLGFPHHGDEYKVMGLAPYGEPRYLESMRQIVRIRGNGTYALNLDFFQHHTRALSNGWEKGAPEVGALWRQRSGRMSLESLLGPARRPGDPLTQQHKDIARSAQALYEEAFFTLLHTLHRRYGCLNLALAGGCALNSVANGKVTLRSPFRNVYLPPAAGDAGGAIGAALVAAGNARPGTDRATRRTGQRARATDGHLPEAWPDPAPLQPAADAWLGPEFDREHIRVLLKDRFTCVTGHEKARITRPESNSALCVHVAHALAEGNVVGWFQGRMEWGPRALGHRSILADPRRAEMKDLLNARIKRRESFRPFAPSILREHVSDWFEQEAEVPFMTQVFQLRPEKRGLVPAVCHIDGSARLQTVTRETDPLFHQLISAFYSLTTVPMVLNTSFNEGEPIVCRPEEALDCFLRTRLDLLVLGPFIVSPFSSC